MKNERGTKEVFFILILGLTFYTASAITKMYRFGFTLFMFFIVTFLLMVWTTNNAK